MTEQDEIVAEVFSEMYANLSRYTVANVVYDGIMKYISKRKEFVRVRKELFPAFPNFNGEGFINAIEGLKPEVKERLLRFNTVTN